MQHGLLVLQLASIRAGSSVPCWLTQQRSEPVPCVQAGWHHQRVASPTDFCVRMCRETGSIVCMRKDQAGL